MHFVTIEFYKNNCMLIRTPYTLKCRSNLKLSFKIRRRKNGFYFIILERKIQLIQYKIIYHISQFGPLVSVNCSYFLLNPNP